MDVQGVKEKTVFFIIHSNRSLACLNIATKDFNSSQRNASEQSLLFAGPNIFFVNEMDVQGVKEKLYFLLSTATHPLPKYRDKRF